MARTMCEATDCKEPATVAIVTRLLGSLAKNGLETKICWDIDDLPKKGYSKAQRFCTHHLEALLIQMIEVLG